MNKSLNAFEEKILHGWEEVYKKSHLTLWILLALKDGPKHAAQIRQFISTVHGDILSVDNQSMYRALRRFKNAQMVGFTLRAGHKGPDLKQYFLTPSGHNVLDKFLKRNVIKVLYTKRVRNLIRKET